MLYIINKLFADVNGKRMKRKKLKEKRKKPTNVVGIFFSFFFQLFSHMFIHTF